MARQLLQSSYLSSAIVAMLQARVLSLESLLAFLSFTSVSGILLEVVWPGGHMHYTVSIHILSHEFLFVDCAFCVLLFQPSSLRWRSQPRSQSCQRLCMT